MYPDRSNGGGEVSWRVEMLPLFGEMVRKSSMTKRSSGLKGEPPALSDHDAFH